MLTLGFSLESGARDGFIDELYIAPAARGRGLGGRALAPLECDARARGLKRYTSRSRTATARPLSIAALASPAIGAI